MEIEVIVRIDNENGVISQQPNMPDMDYNRFAKRMGKTNDEVYGAKWTDRGLIYTHKMNANGEFEEIIKSQEEIKAEAWDIILNTICGNPNYHLTLEKDCCNYPNYKFYLRVSTDYEYETYEITKEQYETLEKAGVE